MILILQLHAHEEFFEKFLQIHGIIQTVAKDKTSLHR